MAKVKLLLQAEQPAEAQYMVVTTELLTEDLIKHTLKPTGEFYSARTIHPFGFQITKQKSVPARSEREQKKLSKEEFEKQFIEEILGELIQKAECCGATFVLIQFRMYYTHKGFHLQFDYDYQFYL